MKVSIMLLGAGLLILPLLAQTPAEEPASSRDGLGCANLALKGFVSLAFDPVGQGEREQTYDPQLKAPAAGWSVND